jgi:hypothetical protein
MRSPRFRCRRKTRVKDERKGRKVRKEIQISRTRSPKAWKMSNLTINRTKERKRSNLLAKNQEWEESNRKANEGDRVLKIRSGDHVRFSLLFCVTVLTRSTALPEPEGLRRGKRLRYEPLEWWRQEKVVYGRRESGITLVPHIKEIRRIPKEVVAPLRKSFKRKRGSTAPRSKSVTEDIVEGHMVYNPEEGWDDDTEQQGIVVDFITKEEVKRRESGFLLLALRLLISFVSRNCMYFQNARA